MDFQQRGPLTCHRVLGESSGFILEKHAVVNRIIPTSDGFIAPTRHGYLLRERFQCPSSRASQQDPLQNFKKAVWMVKSRRREELAAAAGAAQDSGLGSAQGNECKANKRSQVCLIV